MNYTAACNTLNFESKSDIAHSITKVLEKYHLKKQKPDCNKNVLKEARDFILLPLVRKQTEKGKINIKPPFPGISCKDCRGTGKIWTFEKVSISFVCKNCEYKGLDYDCKFCNNTGIITKEKSTGKIKEVLTCTTCKGEGTIERKIFNPVISFDGILKLKFKQIV